MFEPIDRSYFWLFSKTHSCHHERPRKAAVLDVAADLVIYCTNSNPDRDIWLRDQSPNDKNGVLSNATKYWMSVTSLPLDVLSHHPTSRSSSSSIPTESQQARAAEAEHHQNQFMRKLYQLWFPLNRSDITRQKSPSMRNSRR